MWGMSYEEYLLRYEPSTWNAATHDFVGFGTDGRVYGGFLILISGDNLYIAAKEGIRILPKMLLRGFLATEEVAEEVEQEMPAYDPLN